MGIISEEEWQSGKCFQSHNTVVHTCTSTTPAVAAMKEFKHPLKLKDEFAHTSNKVKYTLWLNWYVHYVVSSFNVPITI